MEVTPLPKRAGSWYGVRFTPVGWATQPERRYTVRIANVAAPLEYTVQVISCP